VNETWRKHLNISVTLIVDLQSKLNNDNSCLRMGMSFGV